MRNKLPLLLLYILIINSSCHSQSDPAITPEELKAHLEILAGDELKGRYPGTPEDSLLVSYIARDFKSQGLRFFNEGGIQSFDFISGIKSGTNNEIILLPSYKADPEAFMPFSFSSSGSSEGQVVFAGYGFEFKNDTLDRNDYKGIDVRGKWVLLLRGNPISQDMPNAYSQYEKDRDKAMLAKDKGAAGVLLVSGEKFDSGDDLNAMSQKASDTGIPCFQIKRSLADTILGSSGKKIADLEAKLAKNPSLPSFETRAIIRAVSDIAREKTLTANAIAYLEGSDPQLKDQYIVIGAHHDHLGMGGMGSSSRMPDTTAIHYGADDNASGVASLLEISERLKVEKPSRSIIFATFGAEEKGLLGSAHFVENCPVPLEKVILMINLDMVGRLHDSILQVGGAGTAAGLKTVLENSKKDTYFNLSISEAGYGPSDHASFYSKDKPVLFFTTGAHSEYHTPLDRIELINLEGLRDISDYVADLSLSFANMDSTLSFRESGPKESTSGRYRGKVTFGIMPDVSEEGTAGLKVLAVTPGKPASNGGMKKGDIITAIDNLPVGNIQDYMFRLGKLKPGDRVVVTINRDGSILELLIQL